MDFLFTIGTAICSVFLFTGAVWIYWRAEVSIGLLLLLVLFITVGIGDLFVIALASANDAIDADLYARIAAMLFSMAALTLLFITMLFPFHFAVASSARRQEIFMAAYVGSASIIGLLGFTASGAVQQLDLSFWWSESNIDWGLIVISLLFPIGIALTALAYRTTAEIKRSLILFGLALTIMFVSTGLVILDSKHSYSWTSLNVGIVLAFYMIGRISLDEQINYAINPKAETSKMATKTDYRLLKGRTYIIEEERSDFAFRLFSEILRSRCYDCTNEESFACESLDCTHCKLPCPCKKCEKYDIRTQGLVVTRKHPSEIRMEFLIQTTPVIWLSTVPGKDNIDPTKLSLLTDMIVNFLEKSSNGIVLVEGIEYLITSNDFQRVLRVIDRWSEVVMAKASRLIISISPSAFDIKELALLERNREIVNPEDDKTLEKILTAPAKA